MLTQLIADATALRHELHRQPELSGQESGTAGRVVDWLASCDPTRIITGLGGHGVAAIFDSGQPGKSVLIRCELDALPIVETGRPAWRSTVEGMGHLCGHDGHMAIVSALARVLQRNPPTHGRVILLFQPAEETGAGARAVVTDPKFAQIQPDFAFALHNLPGIPLAQVGVRSGAMNFASEGVSIRLSGRTAHASHPETGQSPAAALMSLMTDIPLLPTRMGLDQTMALATLVHAQLGEAAFGISPGDGHLMATLRSRNDEVQRDLIEQALGMAASVADAHGLELKTACSDQFAACDNDVEATAFIKSAADKTGAILQALDAPFRWSEDFGVFGNTCKSALFVLGAGTDSASLHNPDYDFPDALIAPGLQMFAAICEDLCGGCAVS